MINLVFQAILGRLVCRTAGGVFCLLSLQVCRIVLDVLFIAGLYSAFNRCGSKDYDRAGQVSGLYAEARLP